MFVLAYLAACLIFKNAQRPGIVQKMTIDEFMNSTEVETDRHLIKVVHHKTVAARGPANVVLSGSVITLMQEYYDHIRKQTIPISEDFQTRLFLTHSGNEFRKVSEAILETGKLHGILVPTAKLYRKVVSTESDQQLSNQRNHAIQEHMSHSSATAKKFYHYPNTSKANQAYSDINEMMEKKHFSVDEDKYILYEWSLDKEHTPSLALCQRIVEKYKLTRTKKQVQDRWITLLKKFSRK